ncbi:fibroblast growth factor receptor 4-like [Antedon mediterranea]|uniref:fibroblast growth factor receptor 4-like n=1 Tax=Antedon mediterranea TaxID=105859 RepID=UPI003AF67977
MKVDKLMRRLVTYHILSPDPIEIDKEVIRVEEYCAMMPSKCVAGETYDYKALVYELSLDFSQIQSDEDQKYTVEISVSNEAQLISTAKVKFLIKASAVDPVATMSSPASKTSLPVKIVTGKSQESTSAIGATSSETSLAGPIGGSIGAGLLILIMIVIWVICRRNREKRSDEEFDNIYSIPYSEAPAMNNENCTPTEKNSNVIYDNHIQRVRLNSYDNRKAVNRVNFESELNFEKGAVGGADNINYELPIEDSIEFARENLEIGDKIGEGKFSNVMKARAYNIRGQKQWSVVAVKSLKDLNKKTDFSHELHTLRKLSPHPNLVTLLGICSHEDPFYLIFEFAEHGDLRSFLQAQQSYVSDQGLSLSSGLTPHDLIHFANGIAKGMAFLSANKVIHRDLAARNVLVGEDVQGKKLCKISDFGLSRDVLKKQLHRLSHADGLPVRWMAHESLFEHVYTTMSDVWSFGIVVWEIITLGARPYAELSARQVMTALQAGKRLEKPSHCSDYLYKVMTGCWHEVPGKRPTFSELVETLNPNSNSIVLQFDIFDKRRYSGHFVLNRTDSSDAIPEIDNGHYVDMQ